MRCKIWRKTVRMSCTTVLTHKQLPNELISDVQVIMPFMPVGDRILLNIRIEGKEITVYEEYVVYDFNGIVGTVGGSLGLFVGFSFLDIILLIIAFPCDKK